MRGGRWSGPGDNGGQPSESDNDLFRALLLMLAKYQFVIEAKRVGAGVKSAYEQANG